MAIHEREEQQSQSLRRRVQPGADAVQGERAASLEHDPMPASLDASAALLADVASTQPSRLGPAARRLQRRYGNRHVARAVQRARQGGGVFEVEPEVEEAIQRARGGGQPLEGAARAQMEDTLGADFSTVRVHTGAEADVLNRAIEARAFTTGSDIFFRDGEYSPGSSAGRELLAHELTHVVQQGGGVRPKLVVGAPDDEYEREAEGVARAVVVAEKQAPPEQEAARTVQHQPRAQARAADLREYTIQRQRAPVQVKTDLNKEDIANIVNIHLLDYRDQVKSGINHWSPSDDSSAGGWFVVVLLGNLAWAATCLVNPMAGAAIRAMSFGGAAVGSGLMEKLLAGERVPSDALKPYLVRQASTYVDNLKNNMTDIVDKIEAYLRLRHKLFPAGGWLDTNQKIQERRELVWNMVFDNKVAPWGNSTAIITNTTKEIETMWKRFSVLYKVVILNIHGTGTRYKGEKLREEVEKLYYQAMVESGVADRSLAVKVTKEWTDLREYKVYEFPAPEPSMTKATVHVSTGKKAIPTELIRRSPEHQQTPANSQSATTASLPWIEEAGKRTIGHLFSERELGEIKRRQSLPLTPEIPEGDLKPDQELVNKIDRVLKKVGPGKEFKRSGEMFECDKDARVVDSLQFQDNGLVLHTRNYKKKDGPKGTEVPGGGLIDAMGEKVESRWRLESDLRSEERKKEVEKRVRGRLFAKEDLDRIAALQQEGDFTLLEII